MNRAASIVLLLVGGACVASDEERQELADGAWVGTITAEGNVITVVNESGSVWGGKARLVEQASIGVESGAAEYMLGRVWGVAADDERIYVLDSQVPVLRVYDADGRHVRDIGRRGQGPGEFDRPDGLALGPDGRVYVRVFTLQRINVYDPDGTVSGSLSGGPRFYQRGPLEVSADGTLFMRARDRFVGFAANGATIDPIPYPTYERTPLTVETAGIDNYMSPSILRIPFSPASYTIISSDGAVISGFSDEYRFDVHSANGDQLRIVRRVDPVPIESDESDWHEDQFRDRLVDLGPVVGDMPDMPSHKPLFDRLVPTLDGHVWVIRAGAGARVDCEPPGAEAEGSDALQCWRDQRVVEVFSVEDGRFLGEAELPAGVRVNPRPDVRGDRVVATYQDEAGTIMVKRYRLVLPGEQ